MINRDQLNVLAYELNAARNINKIGNSQFVVLISVLVIRVQFNRVAVIHDRD